MDDDVAARTVVDKLLPERLGILQRVSGVPVVFGGTTRPGSNGRELVITRVAGTFGDSLRDLAVHPGRGLGGTVLSRGVVCRVNDYASTTTITHEYDRIVVGYERLTSIFAMPVVVRGAVHAVLYGAVRDTQPIGDRAVRNAGLIVAQMQREADDLLRAEERRKVPPAPARSALDDLAALIRGTTDPSLRERLARIHHDLGGRPEPAAGDTTLLAPRELDALRLVAVGASNVEIAGALGLSPETVKAYLRTAMRKLNVRNRTGAVHAARVAGIL
ncbi:helix-turn-helix transcriptional regulator [Pseudonocardia bannensis]|uniref:Helix-turn-helix transcriptional regulator n=1 Tax=Pseudonocardia bannensis TaxID=630973 RepID=A0A848DG84_9PSEU|nr:LuxR C-terminal-related transcriptional regulator [Pseudonocardia bannensis]NMH91559.1 helix-turn-helix transcriptional regulator [Pseudonocardia bannensis]